MSEENDNPEELKAALAEELAGMDKDKIIEFALAQTDMIQNMFKQLKENEDGEVSAMSLPETMPTANYFKLTTPKFNMEFNSSDATIHEVVGNAKTILESLNQENLGTFIKPDLSDGMI